MALVYPSSFLNSRSKESTPLKGTIEKEVSKGIMQLHIELREDKISKVGFTDDWLFWFFTKA